MEMASESPALDGLPREVEAKLHAPDPAALGLGPLSDALAPDYRLLPTGRVAMADAYCDTAAFDLLRAGYAFRVRGAPEGVKVTVKSLDRSEFDDVVTQRLELEGRVADPARPLDPAGWPTDLRELVAAHLGHAARLAPYAVLRQERDEYRVLAGGNLAPGNGWPTLAVLSVDDAAVYDPVRSKRAAMASITTVLSGGTPVGRLGELEIELQGAGTEDDVRTVAGRLQERFGLAKSAGSKLERALDLLADHWPDAPAVDAEATAPAPGGLTPDMPMAEAGRLMWRRQLMTVLLTEAGARRGADIEYVHEMRVATRRARAVARLFGPYFKPKAVAAFLKDLRRTARALGAVRDLDVALAKLAKYARGLDEAERDALQELAAEWRIERRVAYRDLVTWLDSRPYRGFIAEFAAFCHTPGAGALPLASSVGSSPRPYQVRHVMPSAILNRFEQVRAYEPLFESARPQPHETLHALRIDCKALRYSLEPVDHLLGEEGRALVKQLKALQDLLGDLNDAAVAHERLRNLQSDGLPPAGLDDYLAHQVALQHELAERAPDAWRAFVSAENRQLVALAVAHL
jgi:CHAD domain-containing protein